MIFSISQKNFEYFRLEGVIRYSHSAGFEKYLSNCFQEQCPNIICIDLFDAEILDSTALGLLAKIANEMKKNNCDKPFILINNSELYEILKRVCFDQVFDIFEIKSREALYDYSSSSVSQPSDTSLLDNKLKLVEELFKKIKNKTIKLSALK